MYFSLVLNLITAKKHIHTNEWPWSLIHTYHIYTCIHMPKCICRWVTMIFDWHIPHIYMHTYAKMHIQMSDHDLWLTHTTYIHAYIHHTQYYIHSKLWEKMSDNEVDPQHIHTYDAAWIFSMRVELFHFVTVEATFLYAWSWYTAYTHWCIYTHMMWRESLVWEWNYFILLPWKPDCSMHLA